jgi:hypothetical protein
MGHEADAAVGAAARLTATDDTEQFIRSLEHSARKVLNKANKQRMAELQAERAMRGRKRPLPLGSEASYSVQVPANAGTTATTLELRSHDMSVIVKQHRPDYGNTRDVAAATVSQPFSSLDDVAMLPKLDKLTLMSRSGPNSPVNDMRLSGTRQLNNSSSQQQYDQQQQQQLPHISRSASCTQAPSSDSGAEHSPQAAQRRKSAAASPAPRIHAKLTHSPLYTAAMLAADSCSKANNNIHGPSRRWLGAANDVWDSEQQQQKQQQQRPRSSSGFCDSSPYAPPQQRRGRRSAALESQGPTSWSSDDLRVKYRSEAEREAAAAAAEAAVAAAQALARETDAGLATNSSSSNSGSSGIKGVAVVAVVERHPVHVAHAAQLELENSRCLLRAAARNKMKRFVLDVHQVSAVDVFVFDVRCYVDSDAECIAASHSLRLTV